MSDILLRELTNADIDWIVTTGTRQKIAPDDIFIRPGEALEQLFVVLEGSFSVRLINTKFPIDSLEIANIYRGEILGESWLFRLKPAISIIAVENSTVLAIPKAALLDKLNQDMSFAGHFYRALALIMTERIRKILDPSTNMLYSSQVVKEVLFIFGELLDSDIDWIVSTGKIKKLEHGEILLSAGHPTDALYIVLNGRLAATITNQPFDPLSMCFSQQESPTENQSVQIVASVFRGGVPGITSFLDFQPLPITYRAEIDSLVLAIHNLCCLSSFC